MIKQRVGVTREQQLPVSVQDFVEERVIAPIHFAEDGIHRDQPCLHGWNNLTRARVRQHLVDRLGRTSSEVGEHRLHGIDLLDLMDRRFLLAAHLVVEVERLHGVPITCQGRDTRQNSPKQIDQIVLREVTDGSGGDQHPGDRAIEGDVVCVEQGRLEQANLLLKRNPFRVSGDSDLDGAHDIAPSSLS